MVTFCIFYIDDEHDEPIFYRFVMLKTHFEITWLLLDYIFIISSFFSNFLFRVLEVGHGDYLALLYLV